MADPIGTVAADVVAKLCSATECPYRYGDSSNAKKKLGDRLEQKLKHRVADGNEVRALEARVASLEKVLKMTLSRSEASKTLSKQDIDEIKKVLSTKHR